MTSETCGNCRFWEMDTDDEVRGYCRRFPPSGHRYFQCEHNGATYFDIYYTEHTIVEVDNWCGEWQPANPTTKES